MTEFFTWESFGADAPSQETGEKILDELNEIVSGLDHEPTVDELCEIWDNYFKNLNGKKADVSFEAGEGRDVHGGVNFMLCRASEIEKVTGDLPELNLYAEVKVPEGAAEDYGYLVLKRDILRQASVQGIDSSVLRFLYDGKEAYLSDEASMGTAIGEC